MPIPLHKMNQLVTYQDRAATSDDDYNAPTPTSYSTVGTLYAWLQAISMSERIRSGMVKGEVTHRVTVMRPDFSIKSTGRFTLGTRVLNIVGPPSDPDERGEMLEMICREEAITN